MMIQFNLPTLTLGLIGIAATLNLTSCSKRDINENKFKIDFCQTFDQCRLGFLEASRPWITADQRGKLLAFDIPTNLPQKRLPVDVLEIPATESPANLILISSGVHGAEAYVGSTLQAFFLNKIMSSIDRRTTSVVMLHTLNPWGAITGRRVTENNVDLNRNFSHSDRLYQSRNPAYGSITSVVNPETPAKTGWIPWLEFYWQAGTMLMQTPMGQLRRALLQGQYQFPDGLYFGGSRPEPVVEPVSSYMAKHLSSGNLRRVLILDIHTGYGAAGHMHLMPNPIQGTPLVRERAEALMMTTVGQYSIEDAVNDPDFYDSTGDFSSFLADSSMAKGIPAVPLILEFGTLDSQTIWGSLTSLYRVVRENQFFHHGSGDKKDELAITSGFREMFFPQDQAWQETVVKQFWQEIPGFIARFQQAVD